MVYKRKSSSTDLESDTPLLTSQPVPPKDTFNLAYTTYFTLGLGYLLPWNAFITAVDYFTHLYPSHSVDRVFSVAYMLTGLAFLLVIIYFLSHTTSAFWRINAGLGLFVVALVGVPLIDWVYVKGRVGLDGGFVGTVLAVALSGVGDALMQGGIIGAAGEMSPRYMQATVAGTAASGVLVSFLRIFTKAVYPQDPTGLRNSANLYFAVGIVIMIICTVLYNVVEKLPVIKYYKELKIQAVNGEEVEKESSAGPLHRAAVLEILGIIKWHGFGIILIYVVTLSIFPGYITEDVHSDFLKDWYPVLLITAFNVFDLIGKCLTAIYIIENEKIAIGGCIARLLFIPLFYGCLHGPQFLRGEISVTILTCLLGLTNGYLTSVLLILAPKVVPLKQAETAGILTVLFLVVGLAIGSIVSWFWVI